MPRRYTAGGKGGFQRKCYANRHSPRNTRVATPNGIRTQGAGPHKQDWTRLGFFDALIEMRLSPAVLELDSMVVNIELTLTSIVQGVALTFLIENTRSVLSIHARNQRQSAVEILRIFA